MSKIIKLKKGLDINLVGEAEKKIAQCGAVGSYYVHPADYDGITPKLLVKVGDVVKAGSSLFFDKNHSRVMFCSPVSGTVSAVNRGEKRKILSIVIDADQEQSYREFDTDLEKMSREDVVSTLLESGLWPTIIQRPYGIIANSNDCPKSVFVSGFDSAPLAADANFVLEGDKENLQKGIQVMQKLTAGKVHLGLKAGAEGFMSSLKGCEIHSFEGPHPAGNVGVQIHHVDPINKGEVVWTVNVNDLAVIGRLFNTGKVDMTKTVALTGSQIEKPQYVKAVVGTPVSQIVALGGIKPQGEGESVRIISGNVLTGKKISSDDGLGFYANQITVIPEGDKCEVFGWAKPFRCKKFSVSHAYFSWLCPKKRYDLDTNLNGGVRSYVTTDLYDRYLPMDIYVMYLIKAILAGDIDKMENLGIYEIVGEDVALCEFVDPSKTDIQEIVRQGINQMVKELS